VRSRARARAAAALAAATWLAPLHSVAEPKAAVGNWGRWGAQDERGAANFITPERIVAAARLVQRGKVISLAVPLDATGPVFPGRVPPQKLMAVSGADYEAGEKPAFGAPFHIADDYLFMPIQGSTQWDALSHAWPDDTLYNGFPQSEIRGSGAWRLGIQNVKDGLVGRGVLIDVLALRGGKLAPGAAIAAADLDAALARQKSRVLPGDIVLIRTGVVPDYYEIADPVERTRFLVSPQAGLALDVAAWVAKHEIAAIAADNLTLERFPSGEQTLHMPLLHEQGVYIGEIFWLEELAEDCAQDGRYEFFLAAQPLNITRAVASPINPVAIK
jgi:kynurenine formamidase